MTIKSTIVHDACMLVTEATQRLGRKWLQRMHGERRDRILTRKTKFRGPAHSAAVWRHARWLESIRQSKRGHWWVVVRKQMLPAAMTNVACMSMSLNGRRKTEQSIFFFLSGNFTTYSTREPRSCWCVIWDLALAPASLSGAVPCQCQGQ